MDQVTKPKLTTADANLDMETACSLARELEQFLVKFRDDFRGMIHPWSMPSLANAIGAIQACQSHLRAAKHHIETPTPDPTAGVSEK
jgi:hypothetical protein